MGWLSFSVDDVVEGISSPSQNIYSLSYYRVCDGGGVCIDLPGGDGVQLCSRAKVRRVSKNEVFV